MFICSASFDAMVFKKSTLTNQNVIIHRFSKIVLGNFGDNSMKY